MKLLKRLAPFLAAAALIPCASARELGNITIQDVPRSTQFGEGPAPEGAPNKGRYTPPLPANPDLPTLWLIGDSTVRNGTTGDNGPAGQWGWGAPITAMFDLTKINVVNRAFGGTSSRTFYNGFFWKDLQPRIRKGDFVILQFGANDNGGAKGKGGLGGIGEETAMNGEEIVHTFGWYLRRFVIETRAQGATPIICSLTPRKNISEDGKRLIWNESKHALWAEQIARETGTQFVPLHDIVAAACEKIGPTKVQTLYIPAPKEKLHTSWEGAVFISRCVVSGLKSLPADPFTNYYSSRASAIAAARGITAVKNTAANGS